MTKFKELYEGKVDIVVDMPSDDVISELKDNGFEVKTVQGKLMIIAKNKQDLIQANKIVKGK